MKSFSVKGMKIAVDENVSDEMIQKIIDLIDPLAPLRRGESVDILLDDGTPVHLNPEDVLISTHSVSDHWIVASDHGLQVALNVRLTKELVQEGIARDIIREIQQLRKDNKFAISDRIHIFHNIVEADVVDVFCEFRNLICSETLADSLQFKAVLGQCKFWLEKSE